MKTNDLLEVAIGMGFDCKLKFALDEYGTEKEFVTIGYNGYRWISDCNIFNPTIGDLILWLMDRGRLDIAYKFEVFFFKERGDHLGFYSLSEKTLKENILNIVLQVIRAEKEK